MANQQMKRLSTTQYGSSSDITKNRLRRADVLLKRWAWIIRRGLPDLGYKHKSPEQALVPDSGNQELLLLPEDGLTATTVSGMTLQLRTIARLHWQYKLTDKEIARRETLTRAKVRVRIKWIKEQVVNCVLI